MAMASKRWTPMCLVLLVCLGPAVRAWGDEPPPPLKHARVSGQGEVLAGPNGMTLYTFANDKEPGKSACIGQCAQNWPPLQPQANAPEPKAPLSVITRDDGSKQYAYKGKPLYYYAKDEKSGEAKGQGLGNLWAVAKP
jgi:predicted lipoprotein with Yx(FWY)xxD motif